jgi:hypothetical protein
MVEDPWVIERPQADGLHLIIPWLDPKGPHRLMASAFGVLFVGAMLSIGLTRPSDCFSLLWVLASTQGGLQERLARRQSPSIATGTTPRGDSPAG